MTARRATRAAMMTSFALACALSLSSCEGERGVCPAGQHCVCPDESLCLLDCDGPGCTFECPPSARCGFQCDDGGCSAIAVQSETCEMGCAGEGCELRCSGGAYCEMHYCSTCLLQCDAASFCRYDKE
jgi:hypothetical protein